MAGNLRREWCKFLVANGRPSSRSRSRQCTNAAKTGDDDSDRTVRTVSSGKPRHSAVSAPLSPSTARSMKTVRKAIGTRSMAAVARLASSAAAALQLGQQHEHNGDRRSHERLATRVVPTESRGGNALPVFDTGVAKTSPPWERPANAGDSEASAGGAPPRCADRRSASLPPWPPTPATSSGSPSATASSRSA
jgi:hypothetical protein